MQYKKLIIYINMFRILLVKFYMHISKERVIIAEDLERWKSILYKEYKEKNDLVFLGYLLIFKQEYRNLMYYRLKQKNRIMAVSFKILFPLMKTLYIQSPEIGGGLFIQHGFATIIAARSMGKNCWVNQQVTIGYKGSGNPVIGDNVEIFCGAKVLGDIHISNGCIIGANAVVVKDFGENKIIVGVPARALDVDISNKGERNV